MTVSPNEASWGSVYDSRQAQYEELRDEVEFALRRALHGLKTHNIIVRLKERNSFIEKIGRKKYSDPFKQMPDIVGARVVCRFLDDIQVVDAALRETFAIRSFEDKTASAAPETFAYRSVHYECTIRDEHRGPHYDGIKNLTFEVQVRTILQDAWAVVEHALAYKGPQSIPPELKRDFSALVGLFHVADKQFQQLKEGVAESERKATLAVESQSTSGDHDKVDDLPLDRGVLKAALTRLFPGRDRSEDWDYSTLVEELGAVGIHTLVNLLDAIDIDPEIMSELKERELADGPYPDEDGNPSDRFTDAGFIRHVLDSQHPTFWDSRRSRYENFTDDDFF
ncbi:hypothetical protein [Nocardia sp. NPDC019255]|uniref:GTP pyrophosphokinase n=1 Tax=Nocardia sp. NPDC019255 TaxID=3154591 RepID=UPI0033DF3220